MTGTRLRRPLCSLGRLSHRSLTPLAADISHDEALAPLSLLAAAAIAPAGDTYQPDSLRAATVDDEEEDEDLVDDEDDDLDDDDEEDLEDDDEDLDDEDDEDDLENEDDEDAVDEDDDLDDDEDEDEE